MIKPRYNELSVMHGSVVFLRVMQEVAAPLLSELGVRSYPTFIAGSKSGGAVFSETTRFSGADGAALDSMAADLASSSAPAPAPAPVSAFAGAGRSMTSAASGSAAVTPGPAAARPETDMLPNIKALLEMGFDGRDASAALARAGSVEGALDLLSDGFEHADPGLVTTEAPAAAGGEEDGASFEERKAAMLATLARRREEKAAEDKAAELARVKQQREGRARSQEAEAARKELQRKLDHAKQQKEAVDADKRRKKARQDVLQDKVDRARAAGKEDRVAALEAELEAMKGEGARPAADARSWEKRQDEAMAALERGPADKKVRALAMVRAICANAMDPAKGGAEGGEKFRRLQASNKAFQRNIGVNPGARSLLQASGWGAVMDEDAVAAGKRGIGAHAAYEFGHEPFTLETAARLAQRFLDATGGAATA